RKPSAHSAATIHQAALRLEDASIGLLQQLIGTAKDGQAAVNALVADRMGEIGCEVRTLDYDPATVPLIDEFAARTVSTTDAARCIIGLVAPDAEDAVDDGRSLLLFAHPDTEAFRPDP